MKNFPTTQAFILLLPKVCKEEMNTRCYICPAGAQLSWNLFLSICSGFLLYVTHKVTRLRTIYIFLMVENAGRDHLEWKVSGIYESMQTRTVNSTITGKQNNFASGNSEWVFNTSQQYSSFPRAHQTSSNLLLFLGFWWGRFPKTPKIIFFSSVKKSFVWWLFFAFSENPCVALSGAALSSMKVHRCKHLGLCVVPRSSWTLLLWPSLSFAFLYQLHHQCSMC